MTAAELAECWVPVPMRWRNIAAGDVFVGTNGALWLVTQTEASAGRIFVTARTGGNGVDGLPVDPDEVATVLLPAALRDAMELSRDELGARLLERRTA